MFESILKKLRCPLGGKLSLKIYKRNLNKVRNEYDIVDGLLISKKNKSIYLIINSIPRMVDPILIDSTALKLFLKKYKNKIQLEEKNKIREFYSALSEKRKINKEFNLQWEIFGNETKLYGMDKNSYKSWLFKEMPKKAFEDKFFKDKIIVEGGSGHGLFAEILSPLCKDYIGVDLNVNLSRLKGKNFNNVSFIQANLLKLPLVDNFSDFTFSHGVIHHTPNPKKAFSNLVKTLKKNGCFYLWVYPKESLIFEFLNKILRFFTKRMNNRLLYHMTILFIPLLGIFKPYGKNRLTKNTSKELRHTIYDWLSAKYQYHYSEKEIKDWFKENKFKKIDLTNQRTGVTAIK